MSIKTLELEIQKRKLDEESRDKSQKRKVELLELKHKQKMEEIEAQKELEELKQKNFLTRRNVLGEQDLSEINKGRKR